MIDAGLVALSISTIYSLDDIRVCAGRLAKRIWKSGLVVEDEAMLTILDYAAQFAMATGAYQMSDTIRDPDEDDEQKFDFGREVVALLLDSTQNRGLTTDSPIGYSGSHAGR